AARSSVGWRPARRSGARPRRCRAETCLTSSRLELADCPPPARTATRKETPMTDAAAANTDQAAHWQEAGQAWVQHAGPLDRFLKAATPPLLEAAFPGPGGAVLDIGCGYGTTTLEMARRLGPSGRCLGVDLSAPMLELARGRAAETAGGAEFRQADAQTADLGAAAFDAAMSRFGVMFFEDPAAAFGNIRKAVKPGGRLAFVCWRSPLENAFFSLPAMA